MINTVLLLLSTSLQYLHSDIRDDSQIILIEDAGQRKYCSGSLINEYYVLTLDSCIPKNFAIGNLYVHYRCKPQLNITENAPPEMSCEYDFNSIGVFDIKVYPKSLIQNT